MLEVKDIRLSFSGLVAIDGVSLSVPRGLVQAVIGPNGAGKTSLFNCISAVYRPQRGSISFEGRELVGEQAHAVGQDTHGLLAVALELHEVDDVLGVAPVADLLASRAS
jgi:ABC-type branched-subunit amino acid transport system ATPase component